MIIFVSILSERKLKLKGVILSKITGGKPGVRPRAAVLRARSERRETLLRGHCLWVHFGDSPGIFPERPD